MTYKPPILATIWLGIVAAIATADPVGSNAAPAALSPADLLVRQAADRLDQYSSISAKVRYSAEVFERRIVGAGTYLQGPSASHLLRFELKLQVGDQVTSLQQIADGGSLWTLRQVDDAPTLSRVDIAKVLEAVPAGALGQGGAGQGGHVLGLGGLPRLVRGLSGSFRFNSVQQAQLAGVTVYVTRGSWERAALARLLPDQQAAIQAGQAVDLGKLPRQVPDEVILFLGRDDLFPYRIEYRRKGAKPLLIMELFELKLNTPLDRRWFDYQPGDTPVVDQTPQAIQELTGS